MYSTKTFRLVCDELGIDYIPDCQVFVFRDKVDLSKEKKSCVTTDNKFIDIGKHLTFKIVITNITEEFYNTFGDIVGKQVLFYPHYDDARKFSAIVLKGRRYSKDSKNYGYRFELSLESLDIMEYDDFNIATDDLLLFANFAEPYYDEDSGNWFMRDRLGDYFPKDGEPRKQITGKGNGSDIYLDIDVAPQDIKVWSFIAQYRWDGVNSTGHGSNVYNSTSGSYEILEWFQYAGDTEGSIRFYITTSTGTSLYILTGMTTDEYYKFEYAYDGTDFTIAIYDLYGNIISTATATITLSLSVSNYISVFAIYKTTFRSNFYDGNIRDVYIEKTDGTKIYIPINQESGDRVIVRKVSGTSTTFESLQVAGTLTNFWQKQITNKNDQLGDLNSVGYSISDGSNYYDSDGNIISNNAIIPYDPDNTSKCQAYDSSGNQKDCDYTGQCEYPILLDAEDYTTFKFPECYELKAIDEELTTPFMFTGDTANTLDITDKQDNIDNYIFFSSLSSIIADLIVASKELDTTTTPTLAEVTEYEEMT